ncbi:MAG: hypothetical protein ACYC8T_08830 [Myxococcaceae bacterium]
MTLPLLHLVFLSVWAGVVATEEVVEVLPRRRPELARAAASFHYYIDLLVELPVLLGVLVTGALLLGSHPVSTLLLVKVSCGAFAVAANLFCIAMVVSRHRAADDRLEARTRFVFLSAALGMPPAVAALILGASLAGWLS